YTVLEVTVVAIEPPPRESFVLYVWPGRTPVTVHLAKGAAPVRLTTTWNPAAVNFVTVSSTEVVAVGAAVASLMWMRGITATAPAVSIISRYFFIVVLLLRVGVASVGEALDCN